QLRIAARGYNMWCRQDRLHDLRKEGATPEDHGQAWPEMAKRGRDFEPASNDGQEGQDEEDNADAPSWRRVHRRCDPTKEHPEHDTKAVHGGEKHSDHTGGPQPAAPL